jgi:hypothetical protein
MADLNPATSSRPLWALIELKKRERMVTFAGAISLLLFCSHLLLHKECKERVCLLRNT